MTTSLRTQAAHGVMWSAVQTWGIRLTTALAFIIISRQLQPTEFGLVALCMSVIAVLTLIGDVGMATYLIRKPTIDPTDTSTAFWTGLCISGVMAALLALAAPWMAGVFDEPDMPPLLWALSAGLVVAGAASVPTALMKRELQFKQLAFRGTVATVAGTAVAITLALLGAGAWALVTQSLVRGVVAAVLSYTAVSWRPRFIYSRSEARIMFRFGTTVLGIDLLNQARDRGEDFVLGSMAGTVVLGYWSVANRLVQIVRETGTSVVLGVATPTFARLQHDRARLIRALDTTLMTSAAVMFPAMVLLSVLSHDLIPFLLGQQWASTADAAQLVAITTALATLSWFDRTVFIAIDRLRPEVVMVASFAVIHVGLVVAVAHQSITVIALALLIKGFVIFPVRASVLHRVAGVPWSVYLKPLRIAVAAAAMAGAGYGMGAVMGGAPVVARIVVTAAVSACVYLAVMWLVARPVLTSLVSDARRLRGGGKPSKAAPVSPADGDERTEDPTSELTAATSVERPSR